MIAYLNAARGEARAGDLAERFGVTQATVNKTVARLQRDGLVTTRPYRSTLLTEAGVELPEIPRRRRQIVLAFLRAIGVSVATADDAADSTQTHCSEATLDARRP